jgi:hypothetical protein
MALIGAVLAAASTAQAHAQGAEFRCAPPGTIVERTSGSRLVFRGQDASDPLVCINAHGQHRFLGYWGTQENFFRHGQPQLARLFGSGPDGSGRIQTINYFGTDRYALSNNITETWRIAGTGRVQVPAGTFDTVRVERQFQVVGSTYRYVESLWLDRTSWVPVKARVEHLNAVMGPALTSWEATDVRLGGVQASR